MKASNLKRLTAALFILLALIFGGQVVRFSRYLIDSHDTRLKSNMYNDARLRYNEICCAHKGINSFYIWNHEISLPGYVPWPRPDKMEVSRSKNNDKWVHAYPPWHTTMFYWYGWLPEKTCFFIMTIFFWLCLCFIVYEIVRLAKARFANYGLLIVLAFAMVVTDIEYCFTPLNYGVLVLAAFLLMNKALEKNQNILAGIAWSVMMIKPQVGLLFVWPLFWKRRYLSIIVAVAICLGETLITSFFILHESPIDLILQVPQIGAPYSKGILTDKIFMPIIGESASIIVMGLFFILTGFATWVLHKNRDFIVCCLPVMLAIPVWTYSVAYDRVILLPAYLFLLAQIFTIHQSGKLTAIRIYYLFSAIVLALWAFQTGNDLLMYVNLSERSVWPFVKIVKISVWVVSALVFLVLLFRKEFMPKQEDRSAADI